MTANAFSMARERARAARRGGARWQWMVPVIEPLLMNLPAFLQGLPVPMRLVINMRGVSNHPKLSQVIATDPRAGGSAMPALARPPSRPSCRT